MGAGVAEILLWAYAKHLPDNMPHRHTFFEVCQVGAYGGGRFTVQGREHVLKPGDVFFARPGVVHQIVNTATPLMELFWVSFQWSPSERAEQGEVDALMRSFAESEVAVAPDEDGRIAALWHALRAAAGGRLRPGYEAQITGLMTALLLAIAQAGADSHTPPALEPRGPDASALVARFALRYVHDNLNHPLSLPEIAAHVHVSPRHLSRLFARFAGTSVAAYIVRARLDRACGLLLHTDLPIKEIAAAVGYPDVHYFTRVFTRYFRCPPGAYRQEGGRGHVRKIQEPGALV
jgi:AraC family L-rhamnose operon transcriptional activator RhaR